MLWLLHHGQARDQALDPLLGLRPKGSLRTTVSPILQFAKWHREPGRCLRSHGLSGLESKSMAMTPVLSTKSEVAGSVPTPPAR